MYLLQDREVGQKILEILFSSYGLDLLQEFYLYFIYMIVGQWIAEVRGVFMEENIFLVNKPVHTIYITQ